MEKGEEERWKEEGYGEAEEGRRCRSKFYVTYETSSETTEMRNKLIEIKL